MFRTLRTWLGSKSESVVNDAAFSTDSVMALTDAEARQIYAMHIGKPVAQRLASERDQTYRSVVSEASRIVSGWPGK